MASFVKDDIDSADVVNGTIVDQNGAVEMDDGIVYYGPVWKWSGLHWVNYRNRPVEVFWYDHPHAATPHRWMRI